MKEKENFLDKNTLIAITLVFIAWLSWDVYMRKKYPIKKPVISQEDQEGKKKQLGTEKTSLEKADTATKKKFTSSLQTSLEEKIFSFKGDNLSFDISSTGMGFKKLVLSNIFDRKGEAILLFSKGKYLPFETRSGEQETSPLYFDIKQTSDHSWEGIAVWNEMKIKKILSVNAENFLIKAQIKIDGKLSLNSGISTVLTQIRKEQDQQKGFLSFFIPPDFLSFFVSSSQGVERIPLVSEQDSRTQDSPEGFSSVKAVALGDKYFGQAWIEDKSDVLPQFKIDINKHFGLIRHSVLNPQKDFEISYKMFIGPKDFSLLKREHPLLIHWVDFGWFGSLSRAILQILQIFYSLVGNWGFSIILLTLLVRFILLPFVLSSHRSMEVMKRVQPEIKKVRAKFKDNPQRMNQEVMAVMKSHRANPLGGCLPLLLQIPVFWSLWKALSNSYSLYQSPFIFWIRDLSWKDPYYILPVLMGLVMFIQQKLSPVTFNKEMLRAMQIMPVFMAVFMINLPSGLVLYMLVSTIFGLVQQIYLNKKGDSKILALPQVSGGKT